MTDVHVERWGVRRRRVAGETREQGTKVGRERDRRRGWWNFVHQWQPQVRFHSSQLDSPARFTALADLFLPGRIPSDFFRSDDAHRNAVDQPRERPRPHIQPLQYHLQPLAPVGTPCRTAGCYAAQTPESLPSGTLRRQSHLILEAVLKFLT